jgi:hypothetical protein
MKIEIDGSPEELAKFFTSVLDGNHVDHAFSIALPDVQALKQRNDIMERMKLSLGKDDEHGR